MVRKTTHEKDFNDIVSTIENNKMLDCYIRSKQLIETIERLYFELGGCLLRIVEENPDSLPNNVDGDNLNAYLDKHFGYKKPKIKYLMNNYELLNDILNSWSDLEDVPLVRFKEVLSIVNADNFKELLEVCRNNPPARLKEIVHDIVAQRTPTNSSDREYVRKTFFLEKDQKEFVDEVINRAKKENKVNGDSTALETILINYAANSDIEQPLPPLRDLLQLYNAAEIKDAVRSFINREQKKNDS